MLTCRRGAIPKSDDQEASNAHQEVNIHAVSFQKIGRPHNINGCDDNCGNDKADCKRQYRFFLHCTANILFENCKAQKEDGEVEENTAGSQIGECLGEVSNTKEVMRRFVYHADNGFSVQGDFLEVLIGYGELICLSEFEGIVKPNVIVVHQSCGNQYVGQCYQNELAKELEGELALL